MTENKYDAGRLNLPFVGICTFGKYPYVSDWNTINADVAVLGAPFDLEVNFVPVPAWDLEAFARLLHFSLLDMLAHMIMKMT